MGLLGGAELRLATEACEVSSVLHRECLESNLCNIMSLVSVFVDCHNLSNFDGSTYRVLELQDTRIESRTGMAPKMGWDCSECSHL